MFCYERLNVICLITRENAIDLLARKNVKDGFRSRIPRMDVGTMMLAVLLLSAQWLSVPSAPVATESDKAAQRAADGTSWFATTVTNAAEVASARWTTAGLGVYEVYVNGARVGTDFLKPGFTHFAKTKLSFSYDVTPLLKTAAGAANVFAAEVSSGWWRDKIVNFAGRKSAFRGTLDVTYSDGSRRSYGTDPDTWRCGVAGPVTHAGIYDGEDFDARIAAPRQGDVLLKCMRSDVSCGSSWIFPAPRRSFVGLASSSCPAITSRRRKRHTTSRARSSSSAVPKTPSSSGMQAVTPRSSILFPRFRTTSSAVTCASQVIFRWKSTCATSK